MEEGYHLQILSPPPSPSITSSPRGGGEGELAN